MSADGPHRPRPGVLEQVLEELVGGLRQVFVDRELLDCSALALSGGDGSGGGELLLESKYHGPDVA